MGEAIVAAVRGFLGFAIVALGVFLAEYVWGRIYLPAVGLEAPSFSTVVWATLVPLLLLFFCALAGAAVAGAGSRR